VAYIDMVETTHANRVAVKNLYHEQAKTKRLNGPFPRPGPGLTKFATTFPIVAKSNFAP
jgi:hypothetical protein